MALRGVGLGRIVGLAVMVTLVAFRYSTPLEELRLWTIDFYQFIGSREATMQPAVIAGA